MRRAAVQSLTRLSPKTPGVERIAFYLDDGDQQVRKYCAVAILKADRNRAPGIEHAASKAAEVLSRLAPECFSSEGDCHECLGLASRSWIQEGIEARKRRVEGAKRICCIFRVYGRTREVETATGALRSGSYWAVAGLRPTLFCD